MNLFKGEWGEYEYYFFLYAHTSGCIQRAVEQGITLQRYPFKHVYTGVCKTIKRALTLSVIKQIRLLELPPNSTLDYVRDMFLFSFYTRGMSFVDMAYLHKEDLSEGNFIV